MPNNRKKDDLICIVCDYWWAILVFFLVVGVMLSYKVWYPWLTGHNPGTRVTPSPVVVSTMEAHGTPVSILPTVTDEQIGTPETVDTLVPDMEIGDWLSFTDSQLGYTIAYPSGWFATPQDLKTTEMQDSVLFSDAPGNTNPQARTVIEKARVWIVSYNRNGIDQTQWIIQHFNWISDELSPMTVDGLPAQAATSEQANHPNWVNQMTWIDRGETTLLVWVQYKQNFPNVQALASHILEMLDFASE